MRIVLNFYQHSWTCVCVCENNGWELWMKHWGVTYCFLKVKLLIKRLTNTPQLSLNPQKHNHRFDDTTCKKKKKRKAPRVRQMRQEMAEKENGT